MAFRSLLSCLALLVAPAALAQNSAAPGIPSGTSVPPAQPERQGPEIDVFRDPIVPATSAPPPPVAPTVTPPATTPAPTPTQPARAASAKPRPRATPGPGPGPRAEPIAPTPAQTPVASPAAAPPAAIPTPQPATGATTPTHTPAENPPWGWIAAAVALLLGGIGAYLFLRPARAKPVEQPAGEDRPPPLPMRPTPPKPAATRATLSISLAVEAARMTFAGATVSYRLTLHNHGEAAARDIMVHALLGSADAEQRELLQRFFAGTIGSPLHSVAAIDPGQAQVLEGEVRMAADAIVPVTIDQHPLLIPLIAFDVHYRWGESDVRSGRTGAAFIVGQERDPPTDRLGPFRMDFGPRPFRRPGVRAAGEPLIA